MRKNHISGYLKRVLAVACAAAMVATSVPTGTAFATESGNGVTEETDQNTEPGKNDTETGTPDNVNNDEKVNKDQGSGNESADETTTGGDDQTTTGGDDQTITGGDDQTTTGGNDGQTTGGGDGQTTGGDQTKTGGDDQTTGSNDGQTTGGGDGQTTGGDQTKTDGDDNQTTEEEKEEYKAEISVTADGDVYVGDDISFTVNVKDSEDNDVSEFDVEWTVEGVREVKNTSSFDTVAKSAGNFTAKVSVKIDDKEVATAEKDYSIFGYETEFTFDGESSTVKYGESLKLNVLIKDKDGKTVTVDGDKIEWSIKKSGSEEAKTAKGNSYTFTAPDNAEGAGKYTIEAKYTENGEMAAGGGTVVIVPRAYTVTYHNGETETDSDKDYIDEDFLENSTDVRKLKAFDSTQLKNKEGYTFVGWSTKKNLDEEGCELYHIKDGDWYTKDGTKFAGFGVLDSNTVDLYAQWVDITKPDINIEITDPQYSDADKTYTQDQVIVTDKGTGIGSIYYAVLEAGKEPDENTEWSAFKFNEEDVSKYSFTVPVGSKGVLHVKAEDKSDKTIETEGNKVSVVDAEPNKNYETGFSIVIENTPPDVKLEGDKEVGDWEKITVTATDLPEDNYSGIKTIDYVILGTKYNADEQKDEEVTISSGNAFTFTPDPQSITDLKESVVQEVVLDDVIEQSKEELKAYKQVVFKAVVMDFCGNKTEKTTEIQIDRVPPEVSINLINSSGVESFIKCDKDDNKDDKLSINVTEETGEVHGSIILKKKGEEGDYKDYKVIEISKIGEVQEDLDGFAEGEYTITVDVSDGTNNQQKKFDFTINGNNKQEDLEEVKFIVDRTAPEVSIDLTNDDGVDNYINCSGEDKLTVTVTETNEKVEGAVTIKSDNGDRSIKIDKAGEYSLNLTDLEVGKYTVEVDVSDQTTNQQTKFTYTVNKENEQKDLENTILTVDKTAPIATINYAFTGLKSASLYAEDKDDSNYEKGTIYLNGEVKATITIDDANFYQDYKGFIVNENGTTSELKTGDNEFVLAADGSTYYKVYGKDPAGNLLTVQEVIDSSITDTIPGVSGVVIEGVGNEADYNGSYRFVVDKTNPIATIAYTFGNEGGNYLYDAEKSIADYSAGTVYTHVQPIVNVSVTENNIGKDGDNTITISENKTGLVVDETIKKEGNVYSKEYKPAENIEYLYFYKVFGKDKAGNVVEVHEELGKDSAKIVNSKLKDSKVEEFTLDNSVQSAEENYNAQIRIVYDKTPPVAKVTYDLAQQVGYIYKGETDTANYTKGTVYSNTDPVFKVTITEANTPAGEDGKGKNLDKEVNNLSMVKYAKYVNEENTTETKGFLYKANEEFISAFDKKVDKDGRYYWKVFGTDKAGNKLEVRESFDETTTIAGEDKEKLVNTTKDVDTLEKAKLSYSILRDTVNPVATFDANTPNSRGGIVTSGVWRSYFNKAGNKIGTPEFTIDETNFDGARIEAGYLYKSGSQYSSVTIDEWNSEHTGAYTRSGKVYSIDGSSLDDGVYRFTIEGEDKAGNRIVAGSSEKINELDDTGNGELWTSYKIIDSVAPKMSLTVGQGKNGGSITGVFYRVNQDSLLTYSPFRKVKQAFGSITTGDKSGTSIGYKVDSTVNSSDRNVVLEKEGFSDNRSVSFETTNAEQVFRVLNAKVEDRAGNTAVLAASGSEDYLYLDVTRPTNDNIKPRVGITRKSTPSITRMMGKDGQSVDLYNKNVTLGLNVFDPDKFNSSSGLKQIRVYTTMDGSNVSGANYTFDVNFKGDKGDKKGIKPSELTYQWTKDITFPAGSFQSNNILIRVEAIDNSGNVAATKEYNFGIDTIGPKVTVYFENNDAQNGKYFKADRRARIEFIDRNIDWGMITISTQGSVGGENVRGGEGNGGNDVWSRVASYTVDGDYTLTVTGTDALGNAFVGSVDYTGGGRNVAPREFTIDKTAPVINVSFDNNSAQNGKYYKDARTATISVREHNFNASEVKVTQTADIQQGSVSAPGVGGFGGGGDDHSASIHYGEDGNYTLTVNYTDLAGNPAQEVRVDEFVIDQTPPTLKFVMPDETKGTSQIFAGDIAPQIDFGDINMTRGMASISLTGMKANSNALNLIEDSFENFQGTVRYENLKKVRESDDIYTATAVVTDLAGNTVEKTITFSVNRFGSTYDYNKNDFTTNLVSGYYTNEPKDVILREINVNQLSEHKLTLYKDGDNRTLTEGTDYSFEERMVNGHYEYIYTIFAKNFEEEGNYNIIATSKDKANNTNSNSTVKGDDGSNEVPLRFAVDKTAPTNLITGVDITKNKFTEDHITLYIEPRDNMNAVASFIVRVTDKNGNILQEFEISGKELAEYFEKNKGVYTLTIDQNNQWQTIEVVTTDAAGNESVDHRIEQNTAYKVLVTPNLFYQYINRLPLVGGSLAALAGLIFFLIAKRKKDDEEEENAA